MNYEVDVHTHTIASGHAYSTIQEMAAAAAEKGLKVLGITEHAPLMPGTCQTIYFHNLRVVPRNINGVQLLLGAELNIMNREGHVDLDEDSLRRLDVRIASVHRNVFPPTTKADLNSAIRAVLNNPYIDILGHPDDGNYEYDYSMIAELAAENGTIIEINNASLRPTGIRPNAYENDLQLLEACKQYKVPVLIGSDAHISYDVAAHEEAIKVVQEADYPLDLVYNYHSDKLLKHLKQKRDSWEA